MTTNVILFSDYYFFSSKKPNFALKSNHKGMRTYNIILANAKISNGNRGCVALSLTAMYLIRRLITNAGHEVRFFLPDSEDSLMGPHQVSILGETIEYTACGYPIPLSPKGYLARAVRLKSTLDDYKIFKAADYIFDIGQGDSFTDIYGANRFAVINRIHRAARLFGKPYCLLPQTIGPFNNDKIREQACRSLRHAVHVMARDRQSLQFVREHAGANVSVSEMIDVAFFMPYKKKTFPHDSIHVGLNVSALLWHGGYSGDNQFGLIVDYRSLITFLIRYFLKQRNVTIHLVPHVVNSERMVENDYAVCYDLSEEYSYQQVRLAPFFLSPVDAKSYISGLDFFIGSRMHATIAAYSTGVPVVPLAYSRKFIGLFNDSLGYPYVGDMTKENDEEIVRLVTHSFDARQHLKETIRGDMDTKVEEYHQQFNTKILELLRL